MVMVIVLVLGRLQQLMRGVVRGSRLDQPIGIPILRIDNNYILHKIGNRIKPYSHQWHLTSTQNKEQQDLKT